MTPGWTKMSLVVILDLPKIKPTVPGSKGPQTPLGATISSSCSFKMSSLLVTKCSPALLWVASWRLEIVHFLEFPDIDCCSESSDWGWGHWVGAPSEISLNGLAIFVKFRVAFLCPMSALATTQTIPEGKLVITFSAFPCGWTVLVQVTRLSTIVTSGISLNCSSQEGSLIMLWANILSSLDKLSDVSGGSSQGSYSGPAVFVSIFIN